MWLLGAVIPLLMVVITRDDPRGAPRTPPPPKASASDARASDSPVSESGTLAIGTFNIRYDNPGDGPNAWPNRRRVVCEKLAQGDFWGLQEALPSQVRELEWMVPAMRIVARTREADPGRGEACPILYRADRWELDPREHGTFWLSPTPAVAGSRGWDAALPRIATFARFVERTPRVGEAPRSLYLYNLHLDHQGERARLESIEVVLAHMRARERKDPIVVVGDFNAGSESAPLRAVRASESPRLFDAWRAANPDAPEQGTFNGWNDGYGSARIDHIFTTADLVVKRCRIDTARPDGRWPSDHAAVEAVFEWRGR